MQPRYFYTLVVLLCGAHKIAVAGDSVEEKRAARFAANGMTPILATCELPKRCGGQPPNHAKKLVSETGNDNIIDQRDLTFNGMQLTFLYFLGNTSESPGKRRYSNPYASPFLVELTVTDSHWPVMYGLRVGKARTEVERLLGARPAESDCTAYANITTQDEVVLCYDGTKLKSIRWSKWFDG